MAKKYYICVNFMERDGNTPSKQPVTIHAVMVSRSPSFAITQHMFEKALELLRGEGISMDAAPAVITMPQSPK